MTTPPNPLTSDERRDDDCNLRFIRVPTGFTLTTATDTNSTMSSIPGLGRTVGAILSSTGRRIEKGVNWVAERQLGLGPNMAALRVASTLHTHHVKMQEDQKHLFPCQSEYSGKTDFPSLRLDRVCNGVCSRCATPYITKPLTSISDETSKALRDLVAYCQYVPKFWL
jgi:hypothetical protein